MDTAKEITRVCSVVEKLLITKNNKYGDSALNPIRVFSKADTKEQILVRIDDKLNRIQTIGANADAEDTVLDLIGYLILLKIKIDEHTSNDLPINLRDRQAHDNTIRSSAKAYTRRETSIED